LGKPRFYGELNMSDEFESINSRIPDLNAAILQRLSQKQPATSTAPGTFDPYKAMLKKKEEETAPIDPSSVKKWPDEDTKKLEDYCAKMGVIGFSTRMNPIAALAYLKQQLGDDYTGVPLEERVPNGYGPVNPYSKAISKKQILHG
jgi:hypothetical protein